MTQKKLTEPSVKSELSGKRSIRYLRVSTPRQMDTDSDATADGNSIDTQRKETVAKERAMGLTNVGEYIEPGNSAQSIDKRPVFREMLRRITEDGDVDYVVIYMRSRAFRNHFDATVTKRQLLKLDVRLISAKEDFGEGIMADAMEAVTDIFNEVQVRLNGEDVKIKMRNKAMNGGTLGPAPVGYLNVRRKIDGKEIRTVDVDPERAPFIRLAFDWFATGRYSAEQLQEKLTDAGLRLAATARWPVRPISENGLLRLLRDRYYLGEVYYGGVWYPGRHEPLVTDETFDRVQRVLDARAGQGNRQRKHHHYLKGTIWCARCQKRFIIQRARGNGGEYFYWLCRGRQSRECDQPYIPVEVIEEAVEEHYGRTTWLPADLRDQLRTLVGEAAASDTALSDEMRASLDRRLDALDKKEDYFLDLAADEGWPKEKLRTKIDGLREEKKRIERTLRQADQQLATGRVIFEQALDLLERPQALYLRSGETVRAILNKAFFTRLYVDGQKITGQELNEPFDLFHEVYELERNHQAEKNPTSIKAATLTDDGLDDRFSLIHLLDRSSTVCGSSKRVMVGGTGFEPVTPRL